MADRKASVSLELKAGQFKAEAKATEAAVKSFDREVEKLDRDITKIPADAAKAGAATRLLGGEMKEVGKGVKSIGANSTSLTLLDTRIKNSRAEVRKLAEEFEKTGDVSVFQKLGRASGDLRVLQDLRRKLAKTLEDGASEGGTRGAQSFTQLFQGGIIKALSNPAVAALVASVAIPLFSILGSAVGGAVIAGAATGAVGLGIAGAVMGNPKQIGAAWGTEIDAIKARWISASASFEGPTVRAAKRIGDAVRGINLEGILGKASTFVDPLAAGVAGLARGVGDAVEILVDHAGPVIDVLARKLPDIGNAVKRFAELVSGGSENAAKGLEDVIDFVDMVVVGLGYLIAAAEKTYGWFRSMREGIDDFIDHLRETNGLFYVTLFVADKLSSIMPHVIGGLSGGAKSAGDAAKQVTELGAKSDETADQVKSIGDAFTALGQSAQGALTNKILDMMFADADATIAWQESLVKLHEAADKNGTSLDVLNEKTGRYNEKALANEKALIASAKANAEVYQQNLLSGKSAEDAGKLYDENSATLRKQAIAAGYNAGEVDKLIGKYKNVPAEVQTVLATQGLTEALNHLSQILIDLKTLDGKAFSSKYSLTVTTYFKTVGRPYVQNSGNSIPRAPGSAFAQGGIRHAATGMIVGPSNPGTLIGEPQTGGEALIPLRGISQSRAMNFAQVVGNAYGFDVQSRGSSRPAVNVTVAIQPGGGAASIANFLMDLQRVGQLPFVVSTT